MSGATRVMCTTRGETLNPESESNHRCSALPLAARPRTNAKSRLLGVNSRDCEGAEVLRYFQKPPPKRQVEGPCVPSKTLPLMLLTL